jgi:uncharacterized protein (DUF2252 family)
MMTVAGDPGVQSTPEERAAAGKAARAGRPRTSMAEWAPPADRPDPVEILEAQARTRVPDLVPIRNARMASSPFAFYRGAAAVMAHDLGSDGSSGLRVQLCGDAHLVNFGGFAAPDRRLVFDINDFDETLPGPFEWDLQRLAASIEVAGRGRDFSRATRTAAVRRCAAAYRRAMHTFAALTDLELWYQRLDIDRIEQMVGGELGGQVRKQFERTVARAQSKDRFRALTRLTHRVDGELRFVSEPPLLVPAEELAASASLGDIDRAIPRLLGQYRETLATSDRYLLDRYAYRRAARKVVGVGSVGTRCWVVLLIGRDENDPLFLQVKEAGPSVLEPFAGPSKWGSHGERVVVGQDLMQAASDILLGWIRSTGLDGSVRDFYVRQLWDWKASADVSSMNPDALGVYSELCGWTVARAHARTGDRIALAAYVGNSDTFDRSLASYAATYADVNERDHAALVEAISAGRVPARPGI